MIPDARLEPIVTGYEMFPFNASVTRLEPVRIAQSRRFVPNTFFGFHRGLPLISEQIPWPTMMCAHNVTLAHCSPRHSSATILIQALFQVGLREDRCVVGAHRYGTGLRLELLSDRIELRVN